MPFMNPSVAAYHQELLRWRSQLLVSLGPYNFLRLKWANTDNFLLDLKVPHYHLCEATEAVKPVLGKYYREPQASKSWFPSHLFEPLVRSFKSDHYVESTGDVVFYKTDPNLFKKK